MSRPAAPTSAIFFEGTDISEFKTFLGPAAAQFQDWQLPQLRREMWAWANFLLDLYESGTLDDFDSNRTVSYDEGTDPRRDRNPNNPK